MRIDEFAVGSRSQFRMRNACFRESFADWSGGMKLSLIREVGLDFGCHFFALECCAGEMRARLVLLAVFYDASWPFSF